MALAHRVAWKEANGQTPEGMQVLHTCDNPPCCNVEHLFLGTNAENASDMVAKGRGNIGEKHGMVKLTRGQVEKIRSDIRVQRVIADDYGVSRSNVSLIKRGKRWRQ